MIATAITYTGEVKAVVDEYNERDPDNKDGDYWNDPNVDPVRKFIKQHYIAEQAYTCCYCQMRIRTRHGRVWDVEHVVARSLRPDFLFEPYNLAVACVDCNNAKDEQPVLTRKNFVRYPHASGRYTIVHPHFDRYEDHIAILLGKHYISKSRKGSRTITMCDLHRFSYAHAGWDAGLASDDQAVELFEEMMNTSDPQIRRLKRIELLALYQIQTSRTLLP